jgi:DNA-binding MarR family transcriptional regulator
MPAEESRAQAQTVVLHMSHLGSLLSARAAASVRDAELVEDLPMLLLFSLDLHGPARPTAIQEITGLSSGGVTKLVERMEAKGMVRRRTGVIKQDRRGVLVELTRKGRQASHAMGDAIAEQLAEARPMAQELTHLLRE